MFGFSEVSFDLAFDTAVFAFRHRSPFQAMQPVPDMKALWGGKCQTPTKQNPRPHYLVFAAGIASHVEPDNRGNETLQSTWIEAGENELGINRACSWMDYGIFEVANYG